MDSATESSHGNASVVSREKSSRGSNSPRRPTRSSLRNFIASAVGGPAELARENFSTAGHANRFATDLKNVRAKI